MYTHFIFRRRIFVYRILQTYMQVADLMSKNDSKRQNVKFDVLLSLLVFLRFIFLFALAAGIFETKMFSHTIQVPTNVVRCNMLHWQRCYTERRSLWMQWNGHNLDCIAFNAVCSSVIDNDGQTKRLPLNIILFI